MSDTTPKAIVDTTGLVLNLVAGSDVILPPGCTLVDIGPGAEPGGTYANGVFTHAKPKPLPVSLPLLTQAVNSAFWGSSYQQQRTDVLTVLSVTTGSTDTVITLGPAALELFSIR